MTEKPTTNETEDAPVEETVADAPGTSEAATPAVDAGAPMASTEALNEPAAEPDTDAGASPPAEAPAPADASAEAAPPTPEPELEIPVVAAAEDIPAPEAKPLAEPAAAAAPTPSVPAEPKRKRKRLPRALRPSTKKGRVKREPATERKPIVRLPKPEREFGRRQERLGTVVSDVGDKTIVVKVDTIKAHPRYKKVVRRSKSFHAHDEQNAAKIGDVVKIIETRPISKTKNWRLAEIVEAAQ